MARRCAGGGDINLSRHILEAIISVVEVRASANQTGAASRALSVKMLTLAINWDRMDIAVSLLDNQEVSDKSNLLIVRALQRALALRKTKFVQMLLTLPTISIDQVHMCPLYASLPSRLTHMDLGLKARMDEQIQHFEDTAKGEDARP